MRNIFRSSFRLLLVCLMAIMLAFVVTPVHASPTPPSAKETWRPADNSPPAARATTKEHKASAPYRRHCARHI
jgi:hypothetical protein